MPDDIDKVLRSVKSADVPDSTLLKVDDVLKKLEARKGGMVMKPKLRKSLAAAAIIAATFLLASTTVYAIANFDAIIGVINREPPNKTIETYEAEGESTAVVALQEGNVFALSGSVYISFTPTGTYRIEGGKLFLSMGDYDTIFLMEKDRLIFESGTWLENWVEIGTVFYLR
jgi:hypothetical protein